MNLNYTKMGKYEVNYTKNVKCITQFGVASVC